MGRRGGGGGEKEPEERKKGKLWVFGSHQPGQKNSVTVESCGLLLFFFFLNQVICCLSFHRSEKETERIQIIKGPYAWGQGRQPSSTFNLKFRRNLLSFQSWLLEPTVGHPRTLARWTRARLGTAPQHTPGWGPQSPPSLPPPLWGDLPACPVALSCHGHMLTPGKHRCPEHPYRCSPSPLTGHFSQ